MQIHALSNEHGIAPRDVAGLRKLLVALLALSFFWVSYIAQTHIHGQPNGAAQTVLSKVVHFGAGVSLNAPSKGDSGDPADCPLCQAVAMGGAVLLPLLLVLLILQRLAEGVPLFAAMMPVAGFRRLSHQTRGPPSL